MRHFFCLLFLSTIIVGFSGSKTAAQPAPLTYPPTPRGNVVDTYYGTKVPDPYRWLESLGSSQTTHWIAQEDALTTKYLDAIPIRSRIRTRIAQLSDHDTMLPPEHNGRYWMRWESHGKDRHPVFYVGTSPDAIRTVLLDPASLPRDEALGIYVPYVVSPNGRYMAYSTSRNGSVWETWHIRDVMTKRDLPDVLRDCVLASPAWLADDSAFYYVHYPAGSDAALVPKLQHGRLYLHRLGTAQVQDRLAPLVNAYADNEIEAVTTADGHYLVIDAGGKRGLKLWAVDLEHGFRLTTIGLSGAYVLLGHDGPRLYFLTYDHAPRGRIIAVDLNRSARITTLVPQQPDTAQLVTLIGNAGWEYGAATATSLVGNRLYVTYLHDAHTLVKIFNIDGSPAGSIPLPEIGTADAPNTGYRWDRFVYYNYTSFAVPEETFRFDTVTGASTLVWKPALPANTATIVTDLVFARSKDGTRIPMFVTHRRGQVRDGTAPTLIWAAGEPFFNITPRFGENILQWIEMGGIQVDAVLRGGTEFGTAWHSAAMGPTKQRTFDDAIACAEKLVSDRWTSPKKLALFGASEGGLMVGAAVTQRPDLFGAAIVDSGLFDMIRGDRYGMATMEFGSADASEAQFRTLLAYSPYHHVRDGVNYPAMLIVAGAHDNIVFPAHSLKFAAAMQHAQAGPGPILLYVISGSGHYAELSYPDRAAFLIRTLDFVPEF